ncbi:hypothetical protein BGW38_008146, partial [Lunasporangiospora selenospora]
MVPQTAIFSRNARALTDEQWGTTLSCFDTGLDMNSTRKTLARKFPQRNFHYKTVKNAVDAIQSMQ